HSPALPCPSLRHANPAGAVLVLLAFTIPVKLHLYPAVLIGVNLLAAGANDNSRLAALHEGLRGKPRRPVRGRKRNAFEGISVTELLGAAARSHLVGTALGRHMPNCRQQPGLIQIVP